MSDQPIVIQLPTALEAQPLLRCLKLPKAEAGANDPPTWRGDHAGRAVSVVLSGVMRQRAADAAEWVVRHLQPAEVVLAGVAGGLDPTLRIADVVQPARVVDAMGGAAFRPTDYDAASGTLITIDEVARLPDQKAALREQHGADAVDMETAAAARVCVSHHVPWRCVRTISDDARTELPPGLMKLIDRALAGLIEMRQQEGKAIEADLLANCRVIEENLKTVADSGPRVLQLYHERLSNRVNELTQLGNVKIDEESLAREVAIYAERCDVAEEVSRLGGHLEQFRQVVEGPETAGRKLDFIAQEMLREANTVASKANDAGIGRAVVEIKTAVDRIKEQVQNVE